MDTVERLAAIEDIRTMMARRVRCLDAKDWPGFADCYTSSAISHSFVSADRLDAQIMGSARIAERVAAALEGVTTVHQLHPGEIEIVSDEEARGIWPLNDVLSREEGGRRVWMRGYGHYRQTYRKEEGRWRIAEHWLTRLLIERGSEELGS